MSDEHEHDDTPQFDEGWLAETDHGVLDLRKVHTLSAQILALSLERDPSLEVRPGTAELLRGRGTDGGFFFVGVPDDDGHLAIIGQFRRDDLLASVPRVYDVIARRIARRAGPDSCGGGAGHHESPQSG